MTLEEHESVAVYDYKEKVVRLFTTRKGVANKVKDRVGEQYCVQDEYQAWKFEIPMEHCRDAHIVSKVIH